MGVTALVVGTGCDPDLVTEHGLIGLDVTGLVLPPDKDVQDGLAVLAGSEICLSIAEIIGTNDYSGGNVDDCYAITWDGAVEPGTDETCRRLPDPGEIAWTAAPTGCPDGGLPTDSLHLHVLARDAVEPMWWADMDELSQYLLVPAGDGLPPNWRPGPNEAARVFEAGTAGFSPGLVDERGDRGVAWPDDGRLVDVPAAADAEGSVLLRGWADGDFDPRLMVSGAEYVYAVQSVPLSDAASLELVAGYHEDKGTHDAALVRAVVRDVDGRPVYGGPVKWEVTSGWVFMDRHYFVVPDGVVVADCTPSRSAEVHRATIVARLGDLTDSIELELDAPDEESDAACEDPDGLSGCGCATSGATGWPFFWVTLLIVAGRIRMGRREAAS